MFGEEINVEINHTGIYIFINYQKINFYFAYTLQIEAKIIALWKI